MAIRYLVTCCLVVMCLTQETPPHHTRPHQPLSTHEYHQHPQPAYHQERIFYHTEAPYHSQPTHLPESAYHPKPVYRTEQASHSEPTFHLQPTFHPKPVYQSESTYHSEPAYSEPTYHSELAYPSKPTCQSNPAYHHHPVYRSKSTYSPLPAYDPQFVYGHNVPPYSHSLAPSHTHSHQVAIPACAENTTKPWCLEDAEYPTYEIKHAAEYHYEKLLSLYVDVADLNTELSVERPKTLEEETYLCPSHTAYVKPLRAVNTEGKWRVIVNNIDAHYETLTQTTRVEECMTFGEACPLVPKCYESKCLQKSIYHRFLVYDPYDQYFPFAIETFKLPASCACLLGAYTIDH